jgi:3-oxoacyl-[acyl-carrier-protein] synthase-1
MSELVPIPAQDPLVVTGAGLVSPVGRDCASCAAAIRAGIARFFEIPKFATADGARATGAIAYGLTDARSGSDRLLAMAIPAAQEALFRAEAYCRALDPARGRILLSLGAEERPRYEDFDRGDLATLLEEAQLEPLADTVELLRDGHAGALLALRRAASLLYGGEATWCAIGAADSLVESPALTWFDEKGRLKSDTRAHGFIPGEAAAFLVVEQRSAAATRGATPLAELAALAIGHEKANVLGDEPLRGLGLAEAIAPVVKAARGDVAGILCDLNGEYYRMKEWGLAIGRAFEGAGAVPTLWHPAVSIGDVGAASAAAHVAIATTAFARGYFAGSRLLAWSASDSGARACALVRAPQ